MKARPIIFIIALALIPSLSFADPKADATISFHPLPNKEDFSILESELTRMAEAALSKDSVYKAKDKKRESLEKKRDDLDKQELKRQAAFEKCWAACPDVLYVGDGDYRCRYSQRCNRCGGNCNSRFTKAQEDIIKKYEKLQQQIGELDEELLHFKEVTFQGYNYNEDEVNEFIGCINGVIDGKAVYKERTYTSLDECLKAHGWERISK